MHVSSLDLNKFMGHDRTTLEFPERGVVLITGHNGSGKSCVYEAVSAAGWGKTVRGSNWFRKDAKSSVQMETPYYGDTGPQLLAVERVKNKSGSPKLAFGLDGEPEQEKYPTTGKAQDALLRYIDEWGTWRITSVFLSEDSSTFTKATDGDRKKLIEKLMDVEQYDPAFKACNADLRQAKASYDKKRSDIRVLEERLSGFKARLAEYKAEAEMREEAKDQEELEDISELEARQKKLHNSIRECAQEMEDLRKLIRQKELGLRDVENELAVARRECKRLDHDNCPTCNQPIPEELKAPLKKKVEEAEARVSAIVEEVDGEVATRRGELNDLRDEKDGITTEKQRVDLDIATHQSRLRQKVAADHARETLAGRIEKGTSMVAETEEELEKLEEECEEIQIEVDELEACAKVLGLKGFRAHLMGQALSAIESVANRWLEKIARKGMTLELKPYTEKKTGGVKDEIGLTIHGCAGGEGYDGASSGEKRRIDVALLFALAEFAAVSRGAKQGTLWLDEIMDSLDKDGVRAVVDVVKELAEERTVVVISHNEQLHEALSPDVHWHMKDGKLAA